MDSVTHIVLGAAMGELLAGRTLGKKALLLGAIANSLPDIDFVASFWLPTARDVWAHRGITHSFLFVIVMTPLLSGLAARAWPRSGMTRGRWWLFFGAEGSAHLFIDAFNAYGTGWFEPFSHWRVSFHTLFVADPFFSVWLAIATVALLILPARRTARSPQPHLTQPDLAHSLPPGSARSSAPHPARRKWAWAGLLCAIAYLGYALANKSSINRQVIADLDTQHHSYTRYFSTPTPLNSFLWYVVAEDSGGFYTGYRSVFDHQPTHFRWQPKGRWLLQPYLDHPDVHYLLRFSQGFYTVEEWGDTTVFNDLRFGEMKGWEDPKARFVFHYFLQRPGENAIIVQRGRFAGWDHRTLHIFLRRIRGN